MRAGTLMLDPSTGREVVVERVDLDDDGLARVTYQAGSYPSGCHIEEAREVWCRPRHAARA